MNSKICSASFGLLRQRYLKYLPEKYSSVAWALNEFQSGSHRRVAVVYMNKTSRRTFSFSSCTSQKLHETNEALKEQAGHNISVAPYVHDSLSYAFGRSNKELRYCTIAPMLDEMSKREPHSTAVVVFDEGISKSFSQMNEDINRLVNGLYNNLKLRRGDKVAVYSYNNYQFLLIQFACNKLGLVLNPLNPSYKSDEFNYVLNKANPKVLFIPGKNSRQAPLNDHWSVICDKSLLELQNQGSFSDLRDLIILDGEFDETEVSLKNIELKKWHDVYTQEPGLSETIQSEIDQVSSDDIYGIYYTSGTTGFPKGAVITQFNVINNVSLSCDRMFTQRGPEFDSIRPQICVPLPLFHEYAGVLGILSPLMNGGSIVFIGMRYSVKSVYESIIRFKCNVLFATPTILIDLLGFIEQNNIKDLPIKSMLVAGSAVVSELVGKAHRLIPGLEDLRIGYGSSENGVISTIQTTLEPTETRPFTVGPPLDLTEIRIADIKTGYATPLGQSGEVQTRGFNTMLCYLDDPDKTKEAITSTRWYRTGDLGIMDKNGSIQIVGRSKELIVKGGENIYPREVERVLHQHEAIEDGHAFGVPDKRFGEEVCVWIKLKPKFKAHNEDKMRSEILEFCKKKLTYFKVPKYVIFVDEFPLTPVKKIKKLDMRIKTAQMLNLN